jgi:8-oxo-dGTP diphosphatase
MQDVYRSFPVGVMTFVVRDGRLLLGKRINVYGAGTWGLPGGHLEMGEAMAAAAARELSEETGLSAKTFDFSNFVNDKSGNKHYLQVGFVASGVVGDPELKEPDRCEEWRWFKLTELPAEIFPPHVGLIENYRKGAPFADI